MVGLIGLLAVAGCSDPVSDSSEQSYEISQPVGTLSVDDAGSAHRISVRSKVGAVRIAPV